MPQPDPLEFDRAVRILNRALTWGPAGEQALAVVHAELRTLRARVAELEAAICEREARIAELEATLARRHVDPYGLACNQPVYERGSEVARCGRTKGHEGDHQP